MDKQSDAVGAPPGEMGLISGLLLDGKGCGERVGLAEIERATKAGELVWAHFDRGEAGTETWLRERSGLSEATCDALLWEDTRPRARVFEGGIMLILRAPNLNAGHAREDMVSLRLWVEERRVISLRLRQLDSVSSVLKLVERGNGPKDTSEVLSELAHAVLDRMEPVIDELEERVEVIEETLAQPGLAPSRGRLAPLRRELAIYYRHLRPQRSALTYMEKINYLPWFEPHDAAELHEAAQRTTRMTEDVEALRERANLVQEERQRRLNDSLNERMFVSAMAAAVFLPLTFVTGLLGINVGGIPLASHSGGFLIVSVLVVLLGALELWLLARFGWLRLRSER